MRYLAASVGYLIKRIYFFTAIFFFLICVDQVDTAHVWFQDMHVAVQRDLFLFSIGVLFALFGVLDWSIEKSSYPLNGFIKYTNYILLACLLIIVKWTSFYALIDALSLVSVLMQALLFVAVIISIFRIVLKKVSKVKS